MLAPSNGSSSLVSRSSCGSGISGAVSGFTDSVTGSGDTGSLPSKSDFSPPSYGVDLTVGP